MIRFTLFSLLLLWTTAYVNGFEAAKSASDHDDASYYPNNNLNWMLNNLDGIYDDTARDEVLPPEEQPFGSIYEEEFRIPGEQPQMNDSYLCTSFRQGRKSIGKYFIDKLNLFSRF
jgi:hypothetical protein